MEITASGAVSAMLEQKQASGLQEVQVAMFKKTIDANSEGALALVNAATQTPTPKNPPNLGQNIDLKA